MHMGFRQKDGESLISWQLSYSFGTGLRLQNAVHAVNRIEYSVLFEEVPC